MLLDYIPPNLGYACALTLNMEKVISIGRDQELLKLRQAVLEYAGFRVHTVQNEADALREIQKGDCGVLLVCYSLDVELRRRVAEQFRRKCPGGRVVSISNSQPDEPFFGDVIIYGLDGPEVLIEAVRGK
jgi:CheY-like chemotaxis protein